MQHEPTPPSPMTHDDPGDGPPSLAGQTGSAQVDWAQNWPAEQALSQPPQLLESEVMSTQPAVQHSPAEPSPRMHSVKLERQLETAQLPFKHGVPPVQALAQ